ncbi:uncharacterized protein LOC132045760 [Lycium ferocissimum]|uniref:uncharacterized protein LOC132045760 n=1 Tax=Lycium ferocissimum TaxID=112874 RepID=UPI002814CE8A|nr:uncharacterized protein LOC132045760 [Lycium ferocissimum]
MAEDSELWDIICDGPCIPVHISEDGVKTTAKTRKECNDANRKVKNSKIDMLTTEYEMFKMKEGESIHDMHTRFTSIINELHSLGEVITTAKLVIKLLGVLPDSWDSKVNTISEAEDLSTLTVDELNRKLKTNEMKMSMKKEEKNEIKRERSLVLKAAREDSSDYESKLDSYDRTARRNQFPDKKFKRKEAADVILKQTLAALRDSSSEFEEDDERRVDKRDTSMVVIENEASKYESIFELMEKSDSDDRDDDAEVNFLEVKKNLRAYYQNKLMSLSGMLIDAYHALIAEKGALVHEISDSELERDNMLVSIREMREQVDENNQLNIMLERELKKDRKAHLKGKGEASKSHLELKDELKKLKLSLTTEIERSKQLKEDLNRIKFDLDRALKRTWSSDVITSMYKIKGSDKEGIDFVKEKTPTIPTASMSPPPKIICTPIVDEQATTRSLAKKELNRFRGTESLSKGSKFGYKRNWFSKRRTSKGERKTKKEKIKENTREVERAIQSVAQKRKRASTSKEPGSSKRMINASDEKEKKDWHERTIRNISIPNETHLFTPPAPCVYETEVPE